MNLNAAKLRKCPGVYVITNKINNKQYVGESANIKERVNSYKYCRGKKRRQVIHAAIRKYGIENFDFYIEYLSNFKKSDLIQLEGCLIERFETLVPRGYNVLEKGMANLGGYRHTDESREKIRLASTGRIKSEETRKKLSNALAGRVLSPRHLMIFKSYSYKSGHATWNAGVPMPEDLKRLLRSYRLGIPLSEAHKQKISDANKGRSVSEETKQKISKSNTGKVRPPECVEQMRKRCTGKRASFETRVKMSEAMSGAKHPFFGKKHKEESKVKMSESTKGDKHWNFGKSLAETTKFKIGDVQRGAKNHNFGRKGKDNPLSKKIFQFNLSGELVNTFDSLQLAAANTGINFKAISRSCCGKSKTSGGFIWKYAAPEPTPKTKL